jgi:hypothetical protein
MLFGFIIVHNTALLKQFISFYKIMSSNINIERGHKKNDNNNNNSH